MEMTAPITEVQGVMAVDQSRAAMEVQAQVIMARRFPRDTVAAYSRILEACRRPGLANRALYAYTRGGSAVRGPSIRLAEELARSYGNIQCGWRVVGESKAQGWSDIETYAWDLESMYRPVINFRVNHTRDTKQGPKRLTDERDVYELCANMAARRLRACILKVIPSDVVDEAMAQVARTIAGESDVPLVDRVRRMVAEFKQFGVTQEMIEGRLGYDLSAVTPEDFVDLRAIFATLKDGEKKARDFFQMPGAGGDGHDATSALLDAINQEKAA